MPPPTLRLTRDSLVWPAREMPRLPAPFTPRLRVPGTPIVPPGPPTTTAPTSPPPPTTEGALARPDASPDTTSADASVDPMVIAALMTRAPTLATLAADLALVVTEESAASTLLETTAAQLETMSDIDASLRDQLVDVPALSARFRSLAAAAQRLQDVGMELCALGDSSDGVAATLAALDATLARASSQLSEIARYVVIASGAAVMETELTAAVAVTGAIDLTTRAERALETSRLPTSGEPSTHAALVSELDDAIGNAEATLRILQAHARDTRRDHADEDMLTRTVAAATSAGHLTTAAGDTISLRVQIETLQSALTSLSEYREALAERWPVLRNELNRALAAFNHRPLTALTRDNLQLALVTLAGAVGISPAPTLGSGPLTYASICDAALPLIAGVAEVEFGVTHMAAQILHRVFGETGALPTPGDTLEEIDTQRTTMLQRLRRALDLPSDTTTIELTEMVLTFANDPGGTTPLRERLDGLTSTRSALSTSDLAALEILLEERGELSVAEVERLVSDFDVSLQTREALWSLVHSAGGRRLLDTGLNASTMRRIRTELGAFSSTGIPVTCYFADAEARTRRLVEVLGTGVTASRLERVIDGLSSDEVAYLLTRHDALHSPSVGEQLAAALTGASLGECVAVLETADAPRAEADALALRLARMPLADARTHAARTLTDLQACLNADIDVPFYVGMNPSRISDARRLLQEARNAFDSYAAALDGDDAAVAAVALTAFTRALTAARGAEHRVSRMARYGLELAEMRAMAVRDCAAMTAVVMASLATAQVAALTMAGEVGGAIELGHGLMLSIGSGIAGTAAGAAFYAPISLMDSYFGESEYSHFHFREAVVAAVSASVGTGLSVVGLASASAGGVTVSATTRAFVLGLGSANGVLAGSAVEVLTTEDSDAAFERLEAVPMQALRAFVGGAVFSALRLPSSGVGAHLANGGAGALEHLAWQGLTHGELTDGLGEAIIQSVAIGSLNHTFAMGERALAGPRLRPGRRVSFDGGTWRVRRITRDDGVVLVNSSGHQTTLPAWALLRDNPDLVRGTSRTPTSEERPTGGYRDPAPAAPARHDYASEPAVLINDTDIAWMPETTLHPGERVALGEGFAIEQGHDHACSLVRPDGSRLQLNLYGWGREHRVSVSRDGRYIRTDRERFFDFGAALETAAAHAGD